MRCAKIDGNCRITIEPGEHYAAGERCTISTLLGSCVAVCLFDPVNRVIGMNHFMLSRPRNGNTGIITSEAGRYGVHAMELLINDMLGLGAEKKNFRAKAFGGSNILGNPQPRCSKLPTVGDANCSFIREFLALEKIPLVSESLGGTCGRIIHFRYDTFVVYMRRLKGQEQRERVLQLDCRCAERNREQDRQAGRGKDVELWLPPR